MENRKLIILFSLIFGLTLSSRAFAYEVETHAYLTDEVVSIYNDNFSGNKISDGLKSYLLDGSRREDDVPRWMNHFYDPVKNRGLSYDAAIDPTINLGTWQESKNWSNDTDNQNKLTYKVPATIASILTAFEQNKLSDISSETDFTWKKAIEYWIKGDKEKAMFSLGHVLHLIEDVSVPDHTRNDPHPEGSVYEAWTSKFTLENPDGNLAGELWNKKPIILDNLNSYFDGLATYSNNNFYSKDTIGIQSGYNLPEPKYFSVLEDGRSYGIYFDGESKEYPIIQAKGLLEVKNDELLNRPFILSAYWSRLSVKSVQYGAGVIDLFFKEVEKAKNNPDFSKEEPKSFLAQTYDVLKNFISGLFSVANDAGLKLAAVVEIGDKSNPSTEIRTSESDVTNESVDTQTPTVSTGNDAQDEDVAEAARKKSAEEKITEEERAIYVKPISQIIKPVQMCKFSTDKIATHQNLLINEVAWMGGPASANDEWIELKNISGNELDISGWQVLDKNEDIKITFGQGIKIPANGFFLLERTDDDSVPGIKADVIYSGALSNTDEGLRLFSSGGGSLPDGRHGASGGDNCVLVDEVMASSDWPAGISEARRTMERQSNLSWNTYGGNGESLGGNSSTGSLQVMGTPRKENGSVVFLPSGSIQPTGNQTAAVVAQPSPSTPAKILISEIQITGGTGKSNNDFIELYNPNDFQVNLNGYRLVKRTKTGTADSSIKSWTSDAFIPAKGYYLWANSDYTDITATPDVRTSATLANDNGIAVRFGVEDTGTVIDSVGWGANQSGFIETQVFGDNPIANQSISRKSELVVSGVEPIDTNNNLADFVKSKLTPKNSIISGGFSVPELWSSGQTMAHVSHIVISELYADRTGANKDFIELYNPNAPGSSDIDISKWSLQILSANATSTDKITKKNFEINNKIPASGFFLIGIDEYSGSSTSSPQVADMTWASGSLNSSSGATIFLVSGTSTISDFEDSRIVDQVAYGSGNGIIVPEMTALALSESEKSWERKAYRNSGCLSAQGGGEFLGNGCDTDNNFDDFEAREISKPQGSENYMEPRNVPSVPQNFSANYSALTMGAVLNWDESQDYLGATSTIVYELNYATSSAENLAPLASATGTTTHSFVIKETGISHYFSIAAKDKDGLSSLISSADFTATSSLVNLYFYKDTRSTTSKKYLLDFYYDNYPFISDVYKNGENTTWKIAVFYLNKEAPDELELNIANNWQPADASGILGIKYENCSGATAERYSLILPDNSDRCNNGGGIANSALKWEKLEDEHLLLEFLKTADEISFSSSDYISAGLYSFYTSGAGDQKFKISALDRSKFYFQDAAPAHQSPSNPENIELNFDQAKSLLDVTWDKSSDSDTLDSQIAYEINYADGEILDDDNWISKLEANAELSVEPGKDYLIGIRAVDDFGNYSGIVTATYSVPEAPPPYGISNIRWGNLTGTSTVEFSFDSNPYPFMTADKPGAMILFLNQNPPAGYSFSNNTGRWNIGGSNTILKFQYNACGYGDDQLLGGLLMSNGANCPLDGWGLKKDAVRSNLIAGQTSIITVVSGVLSNGGNAAHNFSSADYITIGFYELNGSVFQESAVYTKKIYFQ